jgi:hypothetical protein
MNICDIEDDHLRRREKGKENLQDAARSMFYEVVYNISNQLSVGFASMEHLKFFELLNPDKLTCTELVYLTRCFEPF